MLIRNANVYRNCTRNFEMCDIWIQNEKIVALNADLNIQDEEIMDANGCFVLPGLIDVHTHGRAGRDFVSAPENSLAVIAMAYAEHGVTTVMPTIASAPPEEMYEATRRLSRFQPQKKQASFCGVHWEGRYLNSQKRGAHAPELLAALNSGELENEVFRMCRHLHITAAYELDSEGAFAQKAKSLGATLGLGHTAATYAEAKQAEQWGIASYTHLFNAMPPLHHRDGGAVCAALEGDRFCELICDGVHVSPEMIRLVYRLKGAKTVLISDSMEATDMPDGNYFIAGNPAKVQNGKALTPDGALAGSTLSLEKAVENLMRFCEIPLEDAILCATEAPARQVGIWDECGSVDVGKRADLLFLENPCSMEFKKVMVRGNFIF